MGALLALWRDVRGRGGDEGIEMSVRVGGEGGEGEGRRGLLETWLRVADSVVLYEGSDDEIWALGEGDADAVALPGGGILAMAR
jgi:hypothetical protein